MSDQYQITKTEIKLTALLKIGEFSLKKEGSIYTLSFYPFHSSNSYASEKQSICDAVGEIYQAVIPQTGSETI